jgi:enterochelin esterase-like enzyme
MKTILLTFILFLAIFNIDGQNAYPGGQVMDNLSIKSTIMGKDVKYAVYLPPDFAYSKRNYPVVYLLHGYTDDQTGWVQFGQIGALVDKAIAEQKLPPMIIIMPDGGVTWYMNDYQNKMRFEDMFFQEFIPAMEQKYPLTKNKEFRGIAGLSMGGYGSLYLSLRHPEMFAACAPLSAGIFTDKEMTEMNDENYKNVFGPLYGDNKGAARLTDYWRKTNVLDLIKAIPENHKKDVRIYMDCGDKDFLIHGNCETHLLLTDLKIPHEFRIREGSHTWSYWRTGIVDALAFISQSFIK